MAGARRLLAIGSVALLALAAGGTGASVSTTYASDAHYAGERDATTNVVVAAAAEFGSTWLAAHGVRECATKPGGTIRMAPDLSDVDYSTPGMVRGRALGCDVWLLTEDVALANSRNRDALANLCGDEMHEMAHTGGMSHEDMAKGLELGWEAACRGWAKKVALFARLAREQRLRAAKARG